MSEPRPEAEASESADEDRVEQHAEAGEPRPEAETSTAEQPLAEPTPVEDGEGPAGEMPDSSVEHVASSAESPAVEPDAGAFAESGGATPAADDEFAEEQPPLVETLDSAAARARIQAGLEAMEGEDDLVPEAVDLPPAELRGALEALLLVATKPLSVERLAKLLPGADVGYLDGFLRGLAHRYDHERRGWDLRRIGKGWQLLTRPAFHGWVRQLDRKELPSRLTRSAMETLAIVAYKQPVTRGAIEDIRGVQSGPMLRQLMDLKLVKVVGRDESALGHPLLYGTSETFLERFGLASPDDLPRHHELGV